MVTLTLWGAQTWLTAGVPPSNNCRAFLHSHLSLHWWSFLKPPQCHKSCWELLSALSSRQQATEQGFPCPLQQEAPEAAPGAARCPQIGSRYLVKPCGAGWVRAVRQTPRAPAPSSTSHRGPATGPLSLPQVARLSPSLRAGPGDGVEVGTAGAAGRVGVYVSGAHV